MKRKTLFTLFAFICAASIVAQSSMYSPGEAAKHVGETATITGTVDGVHQSGKGNIFSEHGRQIPESSVHGLYPVIKRRAVS